MTTTGIATVAAEGYLQVMKTEGVGLQSLELTGKLLLSLPDSMLPEFLTLSTSLLLNYCIEYDFNY